MKYTAEFKSINEKTYKIEIETKNGTGTKTITLSNNPFTTNVTSEDKHIYSPIKCGGATIGIITDYYYEDFYTGEAKGVKVTLYDTNGSSNIIEWIGYVTPTCYSQGFDKYFEEIEVDCVDGIAVLKDLPFTEVESEQIMSFRDIIFKCLKQSGCYSYFYISDNVQFTQSGTESIIDKLRISKDNFFDAKKDINQTDDDVAWSCYDVLYQILQFLGYTLVTEGDSVFIIDYDAIKNGNNKYWRYSLSGSSASSATSVEMKYSKHIDESAYKENGTSISLDEVYNKVTVKDEFNSYDNLFPTFGDENFDTNITAPNVNLSPFFHQMTIRDHGLQFGDHIAASPADGIMQDFCILVDTDWYGNWWLNVFKFYESPVFNMIHYNRSTRQTVDLGKTIKYSDLLSYNGAFYYRWYKTDAYQWIDENGNRVNDIYEWLNRQKASYNYNASTADKIKIWNQLFQQIKMVDKIQMSPIICFVNDGDNRFGPGDEKSYNSQTDNDVTKNYPFVTLKDFQSSIFGGVNHFLRIKGKVCSHDEGVTPHKLNDGGNNKDLKHDPDYKRIEQGYLWAKLKWGNQYWDGNGWTTSNVWFKLWYWNNNDRSSGDKGRGIKVLDYFDKDFDLKQNEYNIMSIGEDGIIIPCPTTGNLTGKAELSFTTRDMWGDSRKSHWHPKGNKNDNFYCRYLSKCVFITDLQVTAEIYEGLLGDADLDSDTLYTNVIENGAVSKMDEITFKVCTDDGKKPSYSSVDYLDSSGNSQFVTTLYNKALYNKEKSSNGTDGLAGVFRQEEHYIFKLASQYENPMTIFEVNLKNEGHKKYGTFTDKTLNGKTFIMTEITTDYKYNKTSLKLVEKF